MSKAPPVRPAPPEGVRDVFAALLAAHTLARLKGAAAAPASAFAEYDEWAQRFAAALEQEQRAADAS